jgi:transposase InsO family protein
LSIVDNCTRYGWTFLKLKKNDTFLTFKQFHAAVETQLGYKICHLRTNGGGEYASLAFKNLCKNLGIHQEFTQPHTPHQNGVAERKNCTLLNMSRSLAVASNLFAFLWEESVKTTNTIINLLPTYSYLGITPFELLYGKCSNVSHLRVFGSTCYMHINTKIKN